MNLNKYLFLFIFSLFLWHCGSSSATNTGNADGSTAKAFPAGLAITSPTETDAADATSLVKTLGVKQASAYDAATATIDGILAATSLADCVSEIFGDLTLNIDQNAACYGPPVDYQNHPDGVGGNDPLPGGDVGLWTDNEEDSTEACAAAQLNSRMEGVASQTNTALETLASMICTINNTSGLSLPAAGSSLTLTAEMNTMLAASSLNPVPTINAATLTASSNDVETTDYTYAINITYTLADPANPAATLDVTIQTNMTHRPLDAAGETFRGEFSYYFNSEDSLGNCSRDFGAFNTTNITQLGSVTYEKNSATNLSFNSRYTQACNNNNTAPLVDGILDPSEKATTNMMGGTPNTAGWAANFTIMAADFDPADNSGDYMFQWQAGVNDGTARTFNVHLEDEDSDSLMNGSAFFGYGDDIAESDGSILGIYCNWAGPGGGVGNETEKRQDLAQKQTMEESATAENFEVVTSLITYAPTLSCNYDGTGAFSYDADGDGTIDTNPATVLTHELVDPDSASAGVAASGFALPSAPTSL